ncbi:MAG: O-antigen ligase domain-containing protein [Alsobacter sp.]
MSAFDLAEIPDRMKPAAGLRLPGGLLALGVLALPALAAPAGGIVARGLFVAACGAAGLWTWRQGAARHLSLVIVLFCFAPLARRLVDLSAGYDDSGLMLVGPLLALMAGLPEALRVLVSPDPKPLRGVAIVVGLCVAWATALSMVQGAWMNAASGALKWLAPLLYALALLGRDPEGDDPFRASVFTFAWVLPLMGLYGVWQFVDPQDWDRYWMLSATITSAGLPEPYEVRTFSTLNGPASFATFTAAGLLLVLFTRLNALTLLAMLPAAAALLLSMYRTAWISLAVGILFCTLFAGTRKRSFAVFGVLVAVVVAVVLQSPVSDTIADRLASFGSGTDDGSAQERLDQFAALWNLPDSGLLGSGFTITDAGTPGAMAIDGTLVNCWISMGIVVGIFCVAALVAACARPIGLALRRRTTRSAALGALACGALVQLPLAGIASGELGFLFWTFVALACRAPGPADRTPGEGA